MPDLSSCGLPGYNAAFPQNQSEGSRQFLVIHMLSNGQFDMAQLAFVHAGFFACEKRQAICIRMRME